MHLVKNVVKALNKEKRNERVKGLTLAAALGAAAGAVTALLIAPKSDDINRSLNKLKDKALETVEKGKGKVDELVKEGKDKFEEGKDKFEEGKDKFEEGKDKLDAVRIDIMDGKNNLRDIKEDLKGQR